MRLEADLAELLAEEDVVHLAAAMDPGSVAGVVIYENLWAAPFASATRRAGGQLIANGRIPIQAILAAIEADVGPRDSRRLTMPVRAAACRRGGGGHRRSVFAKAAQVVTKAVTPGPASGGEGWPVVGAAVTPGPVRGC